MGSDEFGDIKFGLGTGEVISDKLETAIQDCAEAIRMIDECYIGHYEVAPQRAKVRDVPNLVQVQLNPLGGHWFSLEIQGNFALDQRDEEIILPQIHEQLAGIRCDFPRDFENKAHFIERPRRYHPGLPKAQGHAHGRLEADGDEGVAFVSLDPQGKHFLRVDIQQCLHL